MRVWIIADNITSPLGFTTEQNLVSVLDGRSGIANYDKLWGIPAMVCASLFSPPQWESILQEGLTRFESLAYCSIREALSRVPGSINILDGRTIMLLSTTKADVENIEQSDYYEHMPAEAAQRIAHRLGLKNPPIVYQGSQHRLWRCGFWLLVPTTMPLWWDVMYKAVSLFLGFIV